MSNLYPPVVAGGYEVRCAATVDRLRERHEIHVLTSTRQRRRCPPDPLVRRDLPILPEGRRALPPAPVAAVQGIRVMRRTLAEVSPELIFVWNGHGIPHTALQLAEQSGIPVAYSVGEHWFGRMYRNDPFTRFLLPGEHGVRALWGGFPRLANKLPALRVDPRLRARAAICWNSNAMRRLCGIPPHLTPTYEATIYPAVPEPERWTRLTRRPSSTPTIAYVGRVEYEKGPDVAYRALAALRDGHGIEARLVLAGPYSEPMRAELDRLADELGIAGSVELRGRLDRDAVGRLLEQAHVMLAPSTWEEPFGLVLLEAALARVPVVASRSGGMPEALHEGEQALFFPIEDHAKCAEALAAVFEHPSKAQARVQAAFLRASELTFDHYLAQMEHFVSQARASFDTPIRQIGSPV